MAIRSRGIGGRKRFSKRCSAVKFAAWVVGREFGGRGIWEFFFFLVNYIYGKSKTIEIVVLYLKENMSRFVNVNVNFRLGEGFFFDEIEIYQNK